MVGYASQEIMRERNILERLVSEPNVGSLRDATGDYALY